MISVDRGFTELSANISVGGLPQLQLSLSTSILIVLNIGAAVNPALISATASLISPLHTLVQHAEFGEEGARNGG